MCAANCFAAANCAKGQKQTNTWVNILNSEPQMKAKEEGKRGRCLYLTVPQQPNEVKSNTGDGGPRVHTQLCNTRSSATHAALQAVSQQAVGSRLRTARMKQALISSRNTGYLCVLTCFSSLAVGFSVVKQHFLFQYNF